MMSRNIIVWLLMSVCIEFSVARRSPNADLVDEFINGPGAGKYSDDILEDARLDVPDLIAKYRYPIEIHKATTEDGYILGVHRIPHGRDVNNIPDRNKPVVLMMHGLLSSSADYVLMGPANAIAYNLAEAGFDVWMGNARGNYYSRDHVSLNPRTNASEFWNFSWEQIGRYDIPAMIDYVLEYTGKSRLHYIGFSQGTTAFWSMASLRPEYNDKIIAMQALAPVAFMEYSANVVFQAIAPFANDVDLVARYLGINELIPKTIFARYIGRLICGDQALTQPLCSNFLFLVAGGDEKMHNSTMLPLHLAHTPAGCSVRQLVHYAQQINNDFFRRFHFNQFDNWSIYGQFTPPDFPLEQITVPVFAYYSVNDVFADLKDLDVLWRRLANPIVKIQIALESFSHLDFIWGTGAKSLVYDRVISIMRTLATN